MLTGYEPRHLDVRPDLVVVGNALSRGNALVEHVLDEGLPYVSGPEWLRDNVLAGRHVLAVSGTHGKTTTSSMLAWILEHAGLAPGFLVGGIPADFGVSARLGASRCFVIEADEYDTAFFDKRSKFVHYRPRTLIINNLEYDHADIFPDLAAIQRQFHHLVRTVPASGTILYPAADANVAATLALGHWSRLQSFGIAPTACDWQASLLAPDGSVFALGASGAEGARIEWRLSGMHNLGNAVAASAAARVLDVPLPVIADALSRFSGVKRRLEKLAEIGGVSVFDDFAHHPTAIEMTLAGMRAGGGEGRIIAVIEPRSNTMRLGAHRERLPRCTCDADRVLWFQPAGVDWDLESVAAASPAESVVYRSTADIIAALVSDVRAGDRIVIMSNGGFEGIHARLVAALESTVQA